MENNNNYQACYVSASIYVANETTSLEDLQNLNQKITQRLNKANWDIYLPSESKEVVEKIRGLWKERAIDVLTRDKKITPELLLLEQLLRIIPST